MAPLHEHPTRRPLLLAAAAIILAAACDSPSEHDHGDDELTAAQRQGVSQVQTSQAHYQNLASAQAAGYTAQFPAGCAESAEGAQGFR